MIALPTNQKTPRVEVYRGNPLLKGNKCTISLEQALQLSPARLFCSWTLVCIVSLTGPANTIYMFLFLAIVSLCVFQSIWTFYTYTRPGKSGDPSQVTRWISPLWSPDCRPVNSRHAHYADRLSKVLTGTVCKHKAHAPAVCSRLYLVTEFSHSPISIY